MRHMQVIQSRTLRQLHVVKTDSETFASQYEAEKKQMLE